MISKGHIANFETLRKAFKNKAVILMECTDVETGKPVITVCAVDVVNGEYEFSPLAKMFDGNPYEELNPPI